ncbi:MAG TPA: GMC family oxidoreductase N-terminal domain-containing protein [Gaiellaceae bacterium]|nr:GMC family oxidoreductase N-terminal domain-containing protein [Gaiellaceae bacterium]
MAAAEGYDVVVVGSGSGGSVVARRLVDAGASVLLLEAGGPDDNPAIHDPSRLFELWESPDDWNYRTVPQAACAGRELSWPRGRVLGGSSALNGMIYVRGDRSDYDTWAYLGNAGWSYDDVLPLFKRSEDFDRGANAYHGAGGPTHVLTRYEPHPVTAAVVAAAREAGIRLNDDTNGESIDGVAFCQLTIKDGVRHGAFTAFVRPVLGAPNLTVRTGARATRLLLEGGRCVGVEVAGDGAVEQVRAAHEVVVCGGTIESPKLLMLSGIGDAAELARHGIDAAVDLPGVGKNLHDHALSPVIYAASRTVPAAQPGLQQLHAHLFARSRAGLVGPDLQPLFFHLPLYLDGMEGPVDGYTLMAGLIRPASRGTIALASADPAAPPLIDPACMSCEADLDALVAAIELCREIGSQPALAEWREAELYPGDVDLRDYVRRTAITYHHQVGSCRMGVDELAVVDPELRVRGVDGLRVADASVMPYVSSGNTHAPTMMIGERAAELVAASAA